ncbi:hypothetical protein AXF21_06485 [Eubacterium minutum ATCC 700079]|nr:hypothetical protein AXF21_06485 [Eubacterium minutum ATCC 700079]
MLDSSTSLMLLILLGVIILVILSVAFLTHMKKVDKDNDIKLSHIDESVREIKQCVTYLGKNAVAEHRNEWGGRETKPDVRGALNESISPGTSRTSTQIKNADVPRAGSAPLDRLVSGGAAPRRTGLYREGSRVPNPVGQSVSKSVEPRVPNSIEQSVPKPEEPRISRIAPHEVHSLDQVLANLERPGSPGGNPGSANKAGLSNSRNTDFKSQPVGYNPAEVSVTETLKAGELKTKDVGIEKVSVPIEKDRSCISRTAADKKPIPTHFVDRSTATDRQGRVYSVDQLKEQIK